MLYPTKPIHVRLWEIASCLVGSEMCIRDSGNNIAGSLALACSYSGMNFTISSPPEYKLPRSIWESADQIARENGTNLVWTEDPQEAASGADIIYTDVWVSMGDELEKEKRLSTFSSYQVNEDLVKHANNDFIFMHDMPAHRGEEISETMLDHPNSVVYDQAENRLHAQKAVLAELFGY